MSIPYVEPSFDANVFNCPYCGIYSKFVPSTIVSSIHVKVARQMHYSICPMCFEMLIWRDATLVIPISSGAPLPNQDMPDDIRKDYEEARSVVGISPRSAAALLRLCIQKLLKHLGMGGTNINADIGRLVSEGLPVSIQQALDTLRVIGNESVHPGELDIRDDRNIAMQLFRLVNIVVHDRISQPREISELYASLPQSKRDSIAKRDGKL